jgi:hypothetical protein
VPSKRLRAFGHFFGNSAGTGNHGVDGLNGNDQISNPDLERWYYARPNSHGTEIAGASHSRL